MANHGVAALLIASLLMAVVLADARITVQVQRDIVGAGFALKAVPVLTCNTVHQVQTGDTCSSVAAGAALTNEQFLGFNPNINCLKIFLGQWVCLDATAA